MKKYIVLPAALLLCLVTLQVVVAQSGSGSGTPNPVGIPVSPSLPPSTTQDLVGWAWSSNIGWVNFNSANAGAPGGNYKVSITTDSNSQTANLAAFSGYAWGPNIGWISFNAADVAGCPASESANDNPPQAATLLPSGNACDPRLDLQSGKVSGWARVLRNDQGGSSSHQSWLHLSGTNHQTDTNGVRFNPASGVFSGFAWENDAIGWLSFNASALPVSCPGCIGGGSIAGSCTTVPAATGNPPRVEINTGQSVQFIATPSGGTGPYKYSWNGVLPPIDNDNTRTMGPYTSPGGYSGPTVVIWDSVYAETPTLTCPNVGVSGGSSSGLTLKARNLSGISHNSAGGTSLVIGYNQTAYMSWIGSPTVADLTNDGYECRGEISSPTVTPPPTSWTGVHTADAPVSSFAISGLTRGNTFRLNLRCSKPAETDVVSNTVEIQVTNQIIRED